MWYLDWQEVYRTGLELYDAQQMEPLETLLKVALLQFPDNGRFIELQGLVWQRQQRFEPARRAFELASSLVPLSIAGQLALADAYRRCGQPADARQILSHLAGRDDIPTTLLSHLTAGLGHLGEYQLALEVSREAVQREPDRDEAIYGMVFYMSKLNYPTECMLPLLRRAVSLAPERQLYRLGLAWISARAGHWDEAYMVCRGLIAGRIECRNCLHFVISVFEIVGDDLRRETWRAELSRRGCKHHGGCACPKTESDQSVPRKPGNSSNA
jgi:tetratricopeptide (TPR) repeat protein